jgi:predicted AAA+ superfamily ATPase
MAYARPQSETLGRRLAEPRRFIQAVAGPRQVGKTTQGIPNEIGHEV